MTDGLRAYLDKQAQEFAQSVQQALGACGGDPMSALRALVIANKFLMEENERLKAQASAGFGAGRGKQARRPQ